ncbi:universal stress protein [Natronorarus salvus]|uniref:universal stress protein n=1 Tax=Natronorarus salvus TaxID=3117733 RepID=UPI002F25FACA
MLFPTDGSEGARVATTHAVDLATTYDATSHVVHVIDDRSFEAETISGTVPEARRERGERSFEEVEALAVDAGVDVVGRIRRGIPHQD